MTRTPGSSKRLSVFDFNEDDERVQEASEKLLGKFGNTKRKRRRSTPSPITKYNFLQRFAGYTKTRDAEGGNEPICVDDGPDDIDTTVGAVGMKTLCERKTDFKACEPIDIDDEPIDVEIGGGKKTLFEGSNYGLVENCADGSDNHDKYVSSPGCTKNENTFANKNSLQADILVLSSSSNYANDCLESIEEEDDEIIEMNLSTSSISTPAENKGQLLQHGSIGHEIDFVDMKVVVFPDFIIYGDIYCTDSRLAFSNSSIRVEGSTVNGTGGKTLVAEWVIGDIINIESEWCELVETAMIRIHLKSKVPKVYGGADETLGVDKLSAGVDKLKFSVYDPYWFEKEDAIKSLDARYKDNWNVVFNNEGEKEENAFFGHSGTISSKPYNYNHHEAFGDVVYPNGDPDAVLISKADLEFLQPERFINDTIIDFYIKYLKHKIRPEDQKRFYFFNSFFFRKLADIDKDLSNVNEGRAAFQRVHKWTRKVDLFEKDYIFVPVNYSLHWSLIVICHPGEVVNFKGDEAENSLRVPCILHMNSVRGSHKGLKNLFQSYLCEEWKARNNESVDVASSKLLDLRFVSLELPQQENSFDCGLFLLHYVELFLEEAPINFSPFKITRFSNFLNRNWFLPAEASLKRKYIKKLIYQILEDQIQKVHSVVSSNKHDSFDRHANEHAISVEPNFKGGCISLNSCNVYSSHNAETGISFLFSALSPPRIVQSLIMEPVSNLKELSEVGNSGRSFSTGTDHQAGTRRRTNFLSPLLEVEQSYEQISDSSSDTESSRGIGGLVIESPDSYLRGESLSLRSSSRKEGCMQLDETCDSDDNKTASSGTQKSSEIGLDDDYSDPEFDGSNISKRAVRHSVSVEDIAACIIEDSLDVCCMNDGNVGRDSPSCHGTGNNFSPALKESDTAEVIVVENDVQTGNENAEIVLVERAEKKSNQCLHLMRKEDSYKARLLEESRYHPGSNPKQD